MVRKVNKSSIWYSRKKPSHSAPGLFPQQINLLGNSEKCLACSYFSLALLKLAITTWILVFCVCWASPNVVLSAMMIQQTAGTCILITNVSKQTVPTDLIQPQNDPAAPRAVFFLFGQRRAKIKPVVQVQSFLSVWERDRSSLFPLFGSIYLWRWPWGARSLLSSKLPMHVLET